MNIKAERIEQLIQIVNRNLQLVYSGQADSTTPLELRALQKVDASVFGHDKFAFEMVHFIKSADTRAMAAPSENTMPGNWEKNFVRGLENLLVECAVVLDDIERDCFISRIYCWFSEKLIERRDLPRSGNSGGAARKSQLDNLKGTIQGMGGNHAHTIKALETFSQKEPSVLSDGNAISLANEDQEHDLPGFELPSSPSRYGTKTIPIYVKHGFPEVLRPRVDYTSFLPKIPGADDNYGMVYNKPETEAEKKMHELWLARRRQEAFEWKTQQHLALVMDRLALHKARLESDALRRVESNTFLATNGKLRPKSADDQVNSRFAPLSKRPNSSRRKILGGGRKAKSLLSLQGKGDDDDASINSSPNHSPERMPLDDTQPTEVESKEVMLRVVSQDGLEVDSKVPKPARNTIVTKATKRDNLPMVFRHTLPASYSQKQLEKNQYYMQLSDSDDDDKPERLARSRPQTKGAPKTGKTGATGPVPFKRDKPIVRERPVSAKVFRDVANNDSEIKVFYRHSNYRRMPLTAAQEQWLDERETERVKKSEDLASALVEAAMAKAEKKKGGKDDKGGGAEKKIKARQVKTRVERKRKRKPRAMEFLTNQNVNTRVHLSSCLSISQTLMLMIQMVKIMAP